MASSAHIYRAADAASALRQCEILANVGEVRAILDTVGTDSLEVRRIVHAYAVIVSQDCDLAQDFAARQAVANEPDPAKREILLLNDKIIPSVNLCQVVTAEAQRKSANIHTDIWARIRQNKDERYHFLQAVEAGCDAVGEGLPELAIDFKRYFSLPTDELYKRIEIGEARRRCRLIDLYLAHLSARYGYFQNRVALPEDHFSEPVVGKK